MVRNLGDGGPQVHRAARGHRQNENNDKAHGELRTEIRDLRTETNTRLDTKVGALAADVHVLVGRQQERDRDRAD